MGLFSRKKVMVKAVHRFDGPGPSKDKDGVPSAYFNIYEHEDGSCHTIEFDRSGAHVAEYDGEPNFPDEEKPEELAEGTPPTTKKAEAAAKK